MLTAKIKQFGEWKMSPMGIGIRMLDPQLLVLFEVKLLNLWDLEPYSRKYIIGGRL